MWNGHKIPDNIKITELFSFFETHRNKDYIFKGESHNFWECVYVKKGNIIVSCDDLIHNLNEGEIVFHSPLVLHKYSVNCETGADLMIFAFSMEGICSGFFKDRIFSLNNKQIYILDELSQIGKQNETEGQFEYLNSYTSTKYSTNFLLKVATQITTLFLDLYDNNTIPEYSSPPDANVFSEAVSYMNSHLDQTPSVLDIAKHCKTSQTALKALFQKYSGLSVHKYLITLKIASAVKLLNDGESVAKVSDKLGFSTPSYFSFVFHRETGIPPTDYKKKRV